MKCFKLVALSLFFSTSVVFGTVDQDAGLEKLKKEASDLNIKVFEISPYVGLGVGPLPDLLPTAIVGTKVSLTNRSELDLRFSGTYTDYLLSERVSLGVNFFVKESETSKQFVGAGALVSSDRFHDYWGRSRHISCSPRLVVGNKSPSGIGKFLTTELEMVFPDSGIKHSRVARGSNSGRIGWPRSPSFSVSTSIEF